jgi:tRNA(Leu) C34 or U34 (ribose-2'-O)-methylase TrmL
MGAVASLRVATIDSWKEFYLAVINAISDRKDALFSYSDPSNEAIKRSSSCGSSITGVRRGKINVYIASAATSQLFADRAESPGAHRKKNKDRAKATVDHSNQRCDVYGSMNSLPIQVHFEAGPLPYYEADFVSPYVLVIGSEARGASKDVWEGVHHAIAAAPTTTPNTTPTTTPTGATAATPLATTVSPADLVSPAGRIDIHFYHIHVPMIDGAVESLNAAVAGSVILSEALRQRIERETDRERGGG